MNILFTPITSSSIAHMVRSFAVADIFIQDGHNVYFTSCTSKKDFIEKRGYQVVKTYAPFNLNDEEDQSINYLSSHKKEMVGWFKAEIDAAKMVKADVIISSPAIFGPHVTYATGIPTVALMNGQYLPSSKGLMGLSFADKSLKSTIFRFLLRPIFDKQFIKKYLEEILDAYRIIGIPHQIKTRKDLYKGMSILIAGDDIFEPQRYLDEKTKFVGRPFWKGFDKMDTDLTEKVVKKFKGKNKLVFVSLGGSIFSKDLYQQIIEITAKLHAKVIIALGPNFERNLFPSDSKNVLIRDFVPGLLLSRISDVVINTGAQGAIMQALVSGTPVISFPIGIDQAYFANRLDELEVGINVNRVGIKGFSKRESYQFRDKKVLEKMIVAVQEIVSNPGYVDNAMLFAKGVNERHKEPAKEIVDYIYEKYFVNV